MRWPLALLVLAACNSPATNTDASVQEDGSYSHIYDHPRDAVYHAAITAAKDIGYSIEVADPMAGRVSGRSEVKRRGLGAQVQYYLLRADIEAPQVGTTGVRVRVTIIFTHHLSGESRTSINDKIVGSREKYDAFFEALSRQLGA
jgi:hypothetical protein